jgi:hypothetical protein
MSAHLYRAGRSTYRVIEPLISFYEAVMRPEWSRLESGQTGAVWRDQRATFLSQVVGPHFEALCRDFALYGGAEQLFGGPPGEIGSGVVNDSANRTQIEIDVAVLAPKEPGRPRRILSLGEAKWGEVMGRRHVERLARARDLLTAKGYETADTTLACYSGAGFHEDVHHGERVAAITLDQIYEM